VVVWWCGGVLMWWCDDVVVCLCFGVVVWWCGCVVMWRYAGVVLVKVMIQDRKQQQWWRDRRGQIGSSF